MLAIRLYLAGLTLTFLFCIVITRGVGLLEATVVVAALVYLILDIRAEQEDLNMLESRVLSLPADRG